MKSIETGQCPRMFLSKYRRALSTGLFFSLFSLMSLTSFAQETVVCKRGSNVKYQRQLEQSTNAENDAAKLVHSILTVVALSSDQIKVQPAIVPNAEVCFAEEGPPYRILFRPSLFSRIDRDRPEGWAKIALLAHEVGHIVNQDFLKRDYGTNPEIELRADEFAGEFLGKYGIELDRALEAYNLDIMQVGGAANTSYPAINRRRNAAERGWRRVNEPNLVWNGDDKALGHVYGRNANGIWVASAHEAVDGYMSFGPYVKLKPGTYKVSFLYRCNKQIPTNWENAITFQVSVFDPGTGGQEVNSSRDVLLSSCTNVVSVSSWIFTVNETEAKANTFEFRVFSYKNAEIRLREIQVEKVVTF